MQSGGEGSGLFKTTEGVKSVFKPPQASSTNTFQKLPISSKMKGRLGARKPTIEEDPESEEGFVPG